jgi:tubulin beta
MTVPEMTEHMFDENNMMCAGNPREGRYITAAAMFRGKIASHEVDDQLFNYKDKHKLEFKEWIPCNI